MADYQDTMPVRIISIDGVTREWDTSMNHLSAPRSLNNRLVLQPYEKKGLQASVQNGFAFVQQKVSICGQKVLVDAKLSDGTFIPKGSTAWIKEEVLHTQQWAQKIYESEGIEGQFIIADVTNVEFVSPPEV